MLKIARKNCYKCDLETIISNDSQYFWINLRDFEAETESKWLNIFNKHGNASTLKYRRELTPNIKFQPDRIFVRNDLFEQIIKSCKATNAEFTMLKEKLGICSYEENYYEEEIIKIQDDIEETSDEELIEIISPKKDETSNESDKETSDEELIEIISPKKDENTKDWYDTNKFKIILTTIDSNNFNHKNKIGKLKFNDINNLINNIKNNTISEALAKQKLDVLNEIRKVETKNKRLIDGQKILLSLFDDLVEAISNNRSENKNDNVSVNESVNDNDVNDDDDDDYDDDYYLIKQLNNHFKTIDETKSFKEQMEILKTKDFLNEYWHFRYHHGNKELNDRIFKAKAANILNDLNEQLFEKIFDHTSAALVDKLINTIGEEENKLIIDDIKKNRDNIYKQSNQPINVVIYSMLVKSY